MNNTSTSNYSTACARILEVLANSANDDDYEQAIQVVLMALLSLLAVLHESQQVHFTFSITSERKDKP